MLVHEFLERSAHAVPRKVALIFEDQRVTYHDLDAMANRLANALVDRGIEWGDRVIVYMPNNVESIVSIFGILKAGGAFVVINPTTKGEKLRYYLHDCSARGIIADENHEALVRGIVPNVPSITFGVFGSLRGDSHGHGGTPHASFGSIQNEYPPTLPRVPLADSDLACLVYTSGSTGEPKGVVERHKNIDFVTTSITSYLENVPDDIVVNVLPFSFDYGLYQPLMVFKFGGTLVLERSFAYPVSVLRTMESEGVTGFPGVPTLFSILLKMDLSRYNLSKLRYITNTADFLPVSHVQRLRTLFPWVRLYSMYGQTECKRVLYLPPEKVDQYPDSVGIAIPGTEVWLEDSNGHRLGPNSLGELVVRGPHVMGGYWNSPELTAQRFYPSSVPGEFVLHTGDLFQMDSHGLLYFISRQDDIIKTRGEKVAPKEIENVLYRLPGVKEAAVIGVPDPVLGQALKAFIATDHGELQASDVILHCKKYLEDLMVPQSIEFRTELPKNPSGKILRQRLV